ncbi:MAG TPA: tetratricopeptide repeat protein, partial [Candidatus Acidoferrales bacterium]
MKSRFPLTSFCVVVLLGGALGQTYDVNGQGSSSSAPSSQQKAPASDASQGSSSQTDSNLGWGSSIDVARQARAAQDALKRHDYTAAVAYAERAAKSAPQNPELWFLLGYAARLEGHYPASVDAYNRGLKLQPNSVRGLAGLAQTYAKMGRDAEAEKLLQRVVEANPKDANSLQLAGELMINSDAEQSIELLKRADAIQPSAHTDLLIAHAYEHLGKTEDSAHYLNRAKNRAPKDPEVLRAVAGQYRDQGQYDAAISTLQSIPSKNMDVLAELAYTYQLAGKPQEAADMYTRVAKNAKGNLGLNLSAAQALAAIGQTDAAQTFLNE